MWTKPKCVAAACAVLAGCNIIAGYPKFERLTTDAVGSGGAGGQGGGGEAGGGVAGGLGVGGAGGEGGGLSLPLDCTWTSVEMVQSLASEPVGYREYDGSKIVTSRIPGRTIARFAIARRLQTDTRALALWTIDWDDVHVDEREAGRAFGFVRIDGSTDAMLIERAPPGQLILSLLLMDDDDVSGASATVHDVVTMADDVATNLDVAATSPGDGTASILYTLEPSSGPFEARLLRWDGVPLPPEAIIDTALGTALTANDYTIVASARDQSNMSHFLLGDQGDGATRVRHFVIPDDVMGMVAPAGDVEVEASRPLSFGFEPRAGNSFLVAYAQVATGLELLLGAVDAADLPTHDPLTSEMAVSLPTPLLFDEGGVDLSPESFVILGSQNEQALGMVMLLAHRTAGMRFAGYVPFPDASVFPDNFVVRRVEPVIVDDGIDTALGGAIYVAFSVYDTDNDHDRLYVGRMSCAP